jgi:DNA-binding MarR family transcriptional regulator
MGLILDKLEKLIIEHGSAAVRADIIALLREEARVADKKIADLEAENATLNDANNKLETENQRLKAELNRLSHTTELDEPKIQIIKLLAQNRAGHAADFEHLMQLQRTHVDYHLNELKKIGYVKESRPRLTRPPVFALTPKGKEYVVLNSLV